MTIPTKSLPLGVAYSQHRTKNPDIVCFFDYEAQPLDTELHTELSQTMLLMGENIIKCFNNLNIVATFVRTHQDEKIGMRGSIPWFPGI